MIHSLCSYPIKRSSSLTAEKNWESIIEGSSCPWGRHSNTKFPSLSPSRGGGSRRWPARPRRATMLSDPYTAKGCCCCHGTSSLGRRRGAGGARGQPWGCWCSQWSSGACTLPRAMPGLAACLLLPPPPHASAILESLFGIVRSGKS